MHTPNQHVRLETLTTGIRQAVSQFLGIPLVIIVGFLALTAVTLSLDLFQFAWLGPVRSFLKISIFGDSQATSALLGQVVSGVITVASITFSILLLAVQQTASTLTSAVYGQFLERRSNQFFFGYFVGLALYALIVLATVSPLFNPVLSASAVLLLTIIALIFLILLIYASISQMRPAIVASAIRHHAQEARHAQLRLLEQTQRTSGVTMPYHTLVRTDRTGYVAWVNLSHIRSALPVLPGGIEIVIRAPIGTYVAYGDTIAEIRSAAEGDFSRLADTLRRAISLDPTRDLNHDPAFAVDQLVNIGWSSYSSAKQSPSTGDVVVDALRDLLGIWSMEAVDQGRHQPLLPVVYPDHLVPYTIDALMSLAVSSTDGIQSRSFAKVVHAYAMVFDRLPASYHQRIADDVLRMLSVMGKLALTEELDEALLFLADVLNAAGWRGTAEAIQLARAELAGNIGKLNNRSTRMPGSS